MYAEKGDNIQILVFLFFTIKNIIYLFISNKSMILYLYSIIFLRHGEEVYKFNIKAYFNHLTCKLFTLNKKNIFI